MKAKELKLNANYINLKKSLRIYIKYEYKLTTETAIIIIIIIIIINTIFKFSI